MMTWEERLAEATLISQLELQAKAEGAQWGPMILMQPPSSWRLLMRSGLCYRSFGTLGFLLDAARKKLESEPSVARELTAAVLDFIDEMKGPSRFLETRLRGLAWKEHANALQHTGDLRAALRAAERAIEVFAEGAALHFERTKASLVLCNIYCDMGETDRALKLARECAVVFLDYRDLTYRSMALTCEGVVLFRQKRFREALAIFTELVEQAESEGDTLTLARVLLNAAECARELGDLEAARDLYPRALAHFETLDLPTEATRVRWGYALSLATAGKTRAAISELYKVRAVYLHLGMNTSAACSALDIVRIHFDEDEDVRGVCADLVKTFVDAGLTQNAIEALAYLRGQATHGTLTSGKIMHVRTYFNELSHTPTLLFARPSDEEG